MLLLYRNQSIDLHSKSIDWFLYESNNGILVNELMNKFYLFFTKQLHPFKNLTFPPFLWTPSFLESLLIFNDFLNPSLYAHFGKLYPPSVRMRGREGNYAYKTPLKSIMGHTIFEKSQGNLLNLVMETVEESGSFIIESHWSPCICLFPAFAAA